MWQNLAFDIVIFGPGFFLALLRAKHQPGAIIAGYAGPRQFQAVATVSMGIVPIDAGDVAWIFENDFSRKDVTRSYEVSAVFFIILHSDRINWTFILL